MDSEFEEDEFEDEITQRSLNPTLTDQDFVEIRNIATVMIENGLHAIHIKNAADTDGDGFDDYKENLTSRDPEDLDDTPTQEEVEHASFGIEE